MGVQGVKRQAAAGGEAVASVDPVRDGVDYQAVTDIPLDSYDAALVCTPDEPKIELLTYLLGNGKHVLVEKPLFAEGDQELVALRELARDRNVVCYTAYNHRFEPHFVRMRDVIASGVLGEIYSVRLFYGNGTARLVRDSVWRDSGSGVLPDLGSHLLDTVTYWFGQPEGTFNVVSANRFENRAFDQFSFGTNDSKPVMQFELTLLSWRNHFYCDVFAEKGSAHISSLCKWGPSTFTLRDRKLPSGRPDEQQWTLVQPDPTWALEYDHFKTLCTDPTAANWGNTDTDIFINRVLGNLARQSMGSDVV
jgi:predicted dehydrogenase